MGYTPALLQIRRPSAASRGVCGDFKVADVQSLPKQLPSTITKTRRGLLAFPAYHLDLGAVTPGPRGFPSPVASGTLRYRLQPSCPSRLLRRHLPVCAVLPDWASRLVSPKLDRAFFPALPDCLSWGCPKIALPPYKFCESSPSCMLPKEPAAFGRVPPSTQHLPPLSFLPTSTAYSSQNPAGLLHPASGHGVRAVSFRASLRSLCSSRLSSRLSPTRHSHPSEPFPRTQPHCVTAAVASSPSSWCLPPSCEPPK